MPLQDKANGRAANLMPDLDCACASVRRVARLVTQLYSQEIGLELEPSQFALLAVVHRKPGLRQASICQALGFDKTTLSRNLRLMEKNGWIERTVARDQRARGYRLTSGGAELLAQASPGWKRAQKKLHSLLGVEGWAGMMKTFGTVARVAVASMESEPEGDRHPGSME